MSLIKYLRTNDVSLETAIDVWYTLRKIGRKYRPHFLRVIFKVLYWGRDTFMVTLKYSPLMFYQLSCVCTHRVAARCPEPASLASNPGSILPLTPTQGAWSEYLTSPCLSFLNSNVKIVMVPTAQGFFMTAWIRIGNALKTVPDTKYMLIMLWDGEGLRLSRNLFQSWSGILNASLSLISKP